MELAKVSKAIPQNLKNNALYERLSRRYIRYREKKVSRLYSDYEPILRDLKDIEKGNTCILMGTGPSLNIFDKRILKKYPVIGVNNSYDFFKPVYHVISDVHVLRLCRDDLTDLHLPKFLCSVAGLEYLVHGPSELRAIPIPTISPMEYGISTDLTRGIFVADNVIVNALQVAYHLGFQNVYLIGCDFDYGQHIEHFDGSKVASETYTYKSGDWGKIFHQLELCREAYECTGRNIYNATVGGKLEVFERRNIPS